MVELTELYTESVELYAERENLFKSLGKELHLNYLLCQPLVIPEKFITDLKELDEKIKNLEEVIKLTETGKNES